MRTRYLVVIATLAVLHVLLPDRGWGVPLAAAGVVIAVTIVRGAHRYGVTILLPWRLLAVGAALSPLAFAYQQVVGRSAADLPAVSHALFIGAMVATLGAFTLFLRARARILDRYLLLDLAIFAVSALVSFKLLVLDPSLEVRPPPGISPGLSSAYLLTVVVQGIVLVLLAALPGRRGPALWALVGLNGSSAMGSLVINLTATETGGGLAITMMVLLGASVYGLAALHPSMVHLTEPSMDASPKFGTLRLVALGAALVMPPVTSAVTYERTGELDIIWVLAPGLVVTALVLVRLRLLFSREQQLSDAVAQDRDTFRSLMRGISDVIFVVGDGGTIRYVSESVSGTLHRPTSDVVGQRLEALAGRPLTGHHGEEDETDAVLVEIGVDGQPRMFELTRGNRIDDRTLHGDIWVLHDVTDRHFLETELRRQAFHDPLTGLGNRALFADRLRTALEESRPVAVLFLDLDDFKNVNDGLGHDVGDRLLEAVAQRLSNAIRTEDFVARLGGDEFAILLSGEDAVEHGEFIAERALDSLVAPIQVGDHAIQVEVSIGIATSDSSTTTELLKNADIAMYRAKAEGKGRFTHFARSFAENSWERFTMQAELLRSAPLGQLRVLYQPVVELSSGRVFGGEALLRWNHPRLGLLSPDRFIALAEETGAIIPMGRWVLQTACHDAAAWADDVMVSVNLSVRQLDHDDIVSDVAAALFASGLPARRLVLEITETTLIADAAATNRRLCALRELGVRIALDDFGTGYSSFATLCELPIDVLKIDQSLIHGPHHGYERGRLVQAVAHMAEALDLYIVAEGVEEQAELDFLRANNCRFAQGFLFDRPLELAAFVEAVARQRIPQ